MRNHRSIERGLFGALFTLAALIVAGLAFSASPAGAPTLEALGAPVPAEAATPAPDVEAAQSDRLGEAPADPATAPTQAAPDQVVERPAAEEVPAVEEPVVEEPAVEEAVVEEAAVEEPAPVEEPVVEEAVVEEPVAEEAAVEEPALVEEPVVEEPAPVEEAVVEEPAVEDAVDEDAVDEVVQPAELVEVEVHAAQIPDPPAPASSTTTEIVLAPPPYDPWHAVRMCESTNTYDINTGNGFYGAYQFTISTWNWVAEIIGRNDLIGVRPDLAAPADQDRMADALAFEIRGGGLHHWPVCGRYYGT